MKSAWIAAAIAVTATTSVLAQSTIYKYVDESGRVTYSNKPMKGATVMELEPITTIPTPAATPRAPAQDKSAARPTPASLTVTQPSLASIEPQLQRKRDDGRRRILEGELAKEQESLTSARNALAQEQQNPTLIAAVRTAQQATEPTPAQLMEMRAALDKASGRIRGLQATVAEHEKNVEALRKELGALKP
ncbi:MAG: DUF4124 domain-containing protein [Betaproteobacteria bacterium]